MRIEVKDRVKYSCVSREYLGKGRESGVTDQYDNRERIVLV